MSRALIAVDESTSGSLVTIGAVWLQRENVAAVLRALGQAKSEFGIPEHAEVHCRVIFAQDQRRKSEFRHLSPSQIIPFIERSIVLVSTAGVRWFSAKCDASKYPKTFRMFEENRDFVVASKHIAGIVSQACLQQVRESCGNAFDMIYDDDKTLVDWGMKARQQAIHFLRTSEHAVQMHEEERPLLELADVAAYVYGRAETAFLELNNRKAQRFVKPHRLMRMESAVLVYPVGAQ